MDETKKRKTLVDVLDERKPKTAMICAEDVGQDDLLLIGEECYSRGIRARATRHGGEGDVYFVLRCGCCDPYGVEALKEVVELAGSYVAKLSWKGTRDRETYPSIYREIDPAKIVIGFTGSDRELRVGPEDSIRELERKLAEEPKKPGVDYRLKDRITGLTDEGRRILTEIMSNYVDARPSDTYYA